MNQQADRPSSQAPADHESGNESQAADETNAQDSNAQETRNLIPNVAHRVPAPPSTYPVHSQIPRPIARRMLEAADGYPGATPASPASIRLIVSGDLTQAQYERIFGQDALINRRMGIPLLRPGISTINPSGLPEPAEDESRQVCRPHHAEQWEGHPGWLPRIVDHLQRTGPDNTDEEKSGSPGCGPRRDLDHLEPDTAAKLVRMVRLYPASPYELSRTEVETMLADAQCQFTLRELTYWV